MDLAYFTVRFTLHNMTVKTQTIKEWLRKKWNLKTLKRSHNAKPKRQVNDWIYSSSIKVQWDWLQVTNGAANIRSVTGGNEEPRLLLQDQLHTEFTFKWLTLQLWLFNVKLLRQSFVKASVGLQLLVSSICLVYSVLSVQILHTCIQIHSLNLQFLFSLRPEAELIEKNPELIITLKWNVIGWWEM